MTEKELRNLFVNKAISFLGCNEADGSHKKIIDIYNAHKPRARGYKVTYKDPWCATTVSAVAAECGLTDIIPTECGCGQMIELFKRLGRWEESDAHTPEIGDIIMYDWGDNGKSDCTGWPEHVGIVCEVGSTHLKIIEGNLSNSVKYRWMAKNGRYIRGYCKPDFASKAAKTSSTSSSTSSTNKKAESSTTKKEPAKNTTSTNAVKEVSDVLLHTLKNGSKGNSVKALQLLLIGNGCSCGSCGADGDFGSATLAAVKKFQKAKGLSVDGIVGAKTWTALLK